MYILIIEALKKKYIIIVMPHFHRVAIKQETAGLKISGNRKHSSRKLLLKMSK